ncbi:sensor histidine kinase [Nannocystaceae bacterium ST9]
MNTLYGSLPSLLAATVAFAIGTSVVLRDRARDEFVLFAVFCFNLGLFHLTSFFHGFSGIPLFGWGAQSISLVLPWTADRCVTSLIPHDDRPRRRSRWQTVMLVLLLGAHAIALFVLLSRSSGDELSTRTDFWDFARWGPWDLVSLGLQVYVILGLLVVALRMRRAARQAVGTAAAPRLRYLFYASLAAIAFGSPAITAIGPVVTAVYLYFVAQTLLRERLLELPELAARILTLTLLIVGVTGLLALLLIWIPNEEGEGGGMLFVFNSAVAAFALIVLLDPVRAEVQSRVESWLFRDRAELRALLVELRFKLLNVIDPDAMVQVVLDALRSSNRVSRASMFLLDARGTSLVLIREIGASPLATTRLDVAKRRPLVERLRTQGPQLRDVLQRERERAEAEAEAELQDCLDTLVELGAALAVPIVSTPPEGDDRARAELIGALFVDDERLIEPFSSEEVELFRQLASQAAITLQNSVVYEQRKERERLAALGEMAAGLAHEIRNPLGAIKGAVQVIEPTIRSNASDPLTTEFLGVIVEEVDRLNRVVTQFLSYSRPFSGALQPVDLTEVVKATLRLVPAARLERIRVDLGVFAERRGELSAAEANSSSSELRLEPHAPALRGDPEALRQVLHNLVLNALDATEESSPPGHVWIELEHRVRCLPDTDAIALTVRDDGPGLSPKTIANLFVPFHTTKTGGTGLGLPISQRIVENHGGMIAVSNNSTGAPGAHERGASFTVLLPVFQGITSTSQ